MCILKGVAGFFLALGLLTLAGGAFFGLRTKKLVEHGLTVTGVVIENIVEEKVSYDHDDHTRTTSRTYRPKVRFRPPNSEEVIFESRVGFGRPAYQKGEAVEVLYDAADPHGAEIKNFWSLWLGPMIAGILGLVFAGIGGGIWVWLWRAQATASGAAAPGGAYRPIQ
jgi:hypothetical protein